MQVTALDCTGGMAPRASSAVQSWFPSDLSAILFGGVVSSPSWPLAITPAFRNLIYRLQYIISGLCNPSLPHRSVSSHSEKAHGSASVQLLGLTPTSLFCRLRAHLLYTSISPECLVPRHSIADPRLTFHSHSHKNVFQELPLTLIY